MGKFCKYCGSELNDETKFCPKCGAKIEEIIENNDQTNENKRDDVTGETKTNPAAVASLVCSLVGLIIAGLPLGIVAICLSVAAKKHIKVFPNEKGSGMATAGLVIGIIDVVFTSIWTIIKTANLF